jgi:hypothetical protein
MSVGTDGMQNKLDKNAEKDYSVELGSASNVLASVISDEAGLYSDIYYLADVFFNDDGDISAVVFYSTAANCIDGSSIAAVNAAKNDLDEAETALKAAIAKYNRLASKDFQITLSITPEMTAGGTAAEVPALEAAVEEIEAALSRYQNAYDLYIAIVAQYNKENKNDSSVAQITPVAECESVTDAENIVAIANGELDSDKYESTADSFTLTVTSDALTQDESDETLYTVANGTTSVTGAKVAVSSKNSAAIVITGITGTGVANADTTAGTFNISNLTTTATTVTVAFTADGEAQSLTFSIKQAAPAKKEFTLSVDKATVDTEDETLYTATVGTSDVPTVTVKDSEGTTVTTAKVSVNGATAVAEIEDVYEAGVYTVDVTAVKSYTLTFSDDANNYNEKTVTVSIKAKTADDVTLQTAASAGSELTESQKEDVDYTVEIGKPAYVLIGDTFEADKTTVKVDGKALEKASDGYKLDTSKAGTFTITVSSTDGTVDDVEYVLEVTKKTRDDNATAAVVDKVITLSDLTLDGVLLTDMSINTTKTKWASRLSGTPTAQLTVAADQVSLAVSVSVAVLEGDVIVIDVPGNDTYNACTVTITIKTDSADVVVADVTE